MAMIAVLCIALTIAGVNELIVLLGGGGSVALLHGRADIPKAEALRWCLPPCPSAAWPSARHSPLPSA